MNEQTRLLLEAWAQKLGTTVNHLWEVMIVQARVSLFSDALMYLALFTFLIFLYKAIPYGIKKADEIKKRDEEVKKIDKYHSSSDAPFGIHMLCIVGAVAGLIFTVLGVFYLSEVMTKIFNPEYWALQQIISAVK